VLILSFNIVSAIIFQFSPYHFSTTPLTSALRMGKPRDSGKQANVKEAVVTADKAEYGDTFDPVGYLVSGYPKVSGYIERMPEVGIFRRFGALGARSLFYLQAELIELEEELIKSEREDKTSNHMMRMKYSTDATFLKASEDEQDATIQKQWKLVQQIMAKLTQYGKTRILIIRTS
jgi:uncharacterized protein DUF6594